MSDQLELFGPCIMGRSRKTEAERLLDCEKRAKALGLRVIQVPRDDGRWADIEINLGEGPFIIVDDDCLFMPWPLGGLNVKSLEHELTWFESQPQQGNDPEPDNRPRKALPRRAAA